MSHSVAACRLQRDGTLCCTAFHDKPRPVHALQEDGSLQRDLGYDQVELLQALQRDWQVRWTFYACKGLDALRAMPCPEALSAVLTAKPGFACGAAKEGRLSSCCEVF